MSRNGAGWHIPLALFLLLAGPVGVVALRTGGVPAWPLAAAALLWLLVPRCGVIGLDETGLDSADKARSKPAKKSLLVLVVEDNGINQQVLSMQLSKAGHRVEVAGNGLEALQALERTKYDLVFMDVQMPEMDGLRATRLWRAREKAVGGRIPVVAVTAGVLPAERQRCLAAGMDDFLAKPIRRADLFAVIARLAGNDAVPDEPAESSPAVPGWLSQLRSLKLSDADIRRLAQTFLDSVPSRLEDLRQAVGTEDAAQVRDVAHSLKGTLAIFSSAGAGLARGLEELGTTRQLGRAQDLLAGLETSVQNLLGSINAFLKCSDPEGREAESRK
jgi:two-component system sensor histidine kinase/response regulator